MSLTSFLKKKDVRAQFRQTFQKPRFSVRRDMLASPLTKNYSLVGTSFDYLLRFYVQRLNPNTIGGGHWIAEATIFGLLDNPPLLAKAQKIVAQAKERVGSFLETGQMDDYLIESALLLGGLDPIFRAGCGHEYIGRVDAQDVINVRQLISIVDPTHFKAKDLCLVNPIFGPASHLVGGADADLVIDDVLIDIKTVQRLELKRDVFNQLIGYYTLHRIGGVGNLQPKPTITKVAVYFSRHAYLHVLDLEQIIDEDTYPDFVEWFKSQAGQEKPKPLFRFRLKEQRRLE